MLYSMIIVDDEAEIRNGLSQYFPWTEIGFKIVATFEDGSKAIDFMQSNEVDVVLTDIRMPGISGIELAKIISEQFPGTMMVFISGYSDFAYARKAIEFGVKHYILKPTIYQELVDVFTKLKYDIEKKRKSSQLNDTNQTTDTKEDKTYYEKIISKIKKFIEENYNNATLETVASYVGMNPYYLSSFFKQHTKTKFNEYVLDIKMKKAAELLLNSSYKIYEICEMIGYKNTSNFGRAFKSYYNVTPREYRLNDPKKAEGE